MPNLNAALLIVSLIASVALNPGPNAANADIVPFNEAYNLETPKDRRPFNPFDLDNRTYGVIVDCGSSGTRAHLYEWDSSLKDLQLLHDIAPMRDSKGRPLSKKITPGLSNFADSTPLEIEHYIQKVLDFIGEHIPEHKHPYTGVYILATAGMRLLSDADQKKIVDIIYEYIKRNFRFAKVKTSVITGANEGMYQWISVNSKAKRFLQQDTNGRTKTYAVIEMGGASVQVVYQLRPGVWEDRLGSLSSVDAQLAFNSQIVEPGLSRNDKLESTYQLLSTTFLGFGSNSARDAYLDLLIFKHINHNWNKFLHWSSKLIRKYFEPIVGQGNKAEELLHLNDPCLPKGFISKPQKKPKIMLEPKNGEILGHMADDEDDKNFSIILYGTGNYKKCKRLVEEMLYLSKQERLNCKKDEIACTMTLIGEPIINFDTLDVLGIGDIYHTTNLMLSEAGNYNHRVITSKTKKICEETYPKLIVRFNDLFQNKKLQSRIVEECFKAIWVNTFLVKGLRMPTTYSTVKTINKMEGDDLEWTLGAVLDKSLVIEKATEIMMMKTASGRDIRVEPTESAGDEVTGSG